MGLSRRGDAPRGGERACLPRDRRRATGPAAPRALVAKARRAAGDEARHTGAMARLARRYGASPAQVRVPAAAGPLARGDGHQERRGGVRPRDLRGAPGVSARIARRRSRHRARDRRIAEDEPGAPSSRVGRACVGVGAARPEGAREGRRSHACGSGCAQPRRGGAGPVGGPTRGVAPGRVRTSALVGRLREELWAAWRIRSSNSATVSGAGRTRSRLRRLTKSIEGQTPAVGRGGPGSARGHAEDQK